MTLGFLQALQTLGGWGGLTLASWLGEEAPRAGVIWDGGSGREGVAIVPMHKEGLDTDPIPFMKIDSKWGSK